MIKDEFKISQDLSIKGDTLHYFRAIGDKHIGEFFITNIAHKYDQDSGDRYNIYTLENRENPYDIAEHYCDSRTGNEVSNDMWYFTEEY